MLLIYFPEICWIGYQGKESFYSLIAEDENVTEMMAQLAEIVKGKYFTKY